MEKKELEHIKKVLYLENPVASLVWVTKSGLQYSCYVETKEKPVVVIFLVPLDEIGDAKFDSKMSGKLLIRYINALI